MSEGIEANVVESVGSAGSKADISEQPAPAIDDNTAEATVAAADDNTAGLSHLSVVSLFLLNFDEKIVIRQCSRPTQPGHTCVGRCND